MIHRGPYSESCVAFLIVMAWLFISAPVAVGQSADFECSAHGFPVLRDSAGKRLADGDFSQWVEQERLHVKITHEFVGGSRRIEERSVFRQAPRLIQEEWSWRELRGGKVHRDFRVNFRSGIAEATTVEGNERKQWSEKVDISPGTSFAGLGFMLAIQWLRQRLLMGERVELRAIGFTPKPRVVSVEISHGGLDEMRMAGRSLRGDRFVIHPKIPWVASLFIDVPDTQIWLNSPAPAGFLRLEGPLVEPRDPITRIDLLPGGESGPAKPVRTSGARGSRAPGKSK
jgi:hypothetical protein